MGTIVGIMCITIKLLWDRPDGAQLTEQGRPYQLAPL